MKNDNAVPLSRLFLFSGMTTEEIEELGAAYAGQIRTYAKNTVVASPDSFAREVGFLLRGECAVERARAEDDPLPLPLNILHPADSFGILTVLHQQEVFPTVIRAKSEAEILFYSSGTIVRMMREHPAVAFNTAVFLAGRVAFLNQKIAAFSGRCAEEKLSAFLLSQSGAAHTNVFPFSAQKVARSLNIGRASLYRALDRMESDGVLRYGNKTISLINTEKLRSYKKGTFQ